MRGPEGSQSPDFARLGTGLKTRVPPLHRGLMAESALPVPSRKGAGCPVCGHLESLSAWQHL